MSQPSITLNTGEEMPVMAFGTLMEKLNPEPEKTTQIIEKALEVGYRHLDTACIYGTENSVGRAIQNNISKGFLQRKDVFVTTKLWRNSYKRPNVVPALRTSLKELGLDYVDMYLIHWPTAFKSGPELLPKDEAGSFMYAPIDYLETWLGMEECYELGLAKAIGLSNFNSKQIQRVLDNCKIKPTNNQIESHPYLTNSKLVDFCNAKGISVTAYAPLAGFNPNYREENSWPTIYTDSRIKQIAEKHKKTPAQVALRFQIQRGLCVAPKSSKEQRMNENFEALSFELSADDLKAIESCNANLRLNHELPDHPYYPFHEEF